MPQEIIMKLLIVDDEELTRTGLISSVDWNALGIHEIYQADDGINGLEMARRHHPEIILCDVRMPRMDGITMLEKLEKEFPNTIPIFMSGYSDKEYLKAAIKLKAVTYIEKPLDLGELQDAIKEARELYVQKARSTRAQALHSMENISRLALQLTSSYESRRTSIDQLLQETGITMDFSTSFTAFVVKLDTDLELIRSSVTQIYQTLKQWLEKQSLNVIYAEKHHQYLVYFVYGPHPPSEKTILKTGEFLGIQHAALARYTIAAGDTSFGIFNASKSYASAVILLQSGFFYPENSFLTSRILQESGNKNTGSLADTPETRFSSFLLEHDEPQCTLFLEQLFHSYERNPSMLINQIKDIYYKLLFVLEDTCRQQQLSLFSSQKDSIAESMEKCFTYGDLHRLLEDRTQLFFRKIKDYTPENPTIYMIKDFIGKNYDNELLSVKDIGSYVSLSASYLCTFFKNETGQTLNQYLTEFRMEKAKQLLGNPRYKITEISSMVGYSDGNYFSKSFKKYAGLSPSEYREKTI